MSERAPLSIMQQADLVDGLIVHCRMVDGALAAEAHVTISKDDANDLIALATRLRRMAPFERDIRRVVTGQ